MSKSPSGFSGGAKANKILGKTTGTPAPKPTASKPTPPKSVAPKTGASKPTTGFTPGALPKKTPKLTPGAPVMGQQRMANPAKAPQVVNAQRMNSTFKKLGF
ncbi:MAG: hypothetical protein GC200_10760 [Tepidisphaera sp.]|nr:hypothetical protein [Tepidisphaera sp.]